MNVQELIDKLQAIEDKSLKVVYFDSFDYYYFDIDEVDENPKQVELS